MLARLYKIREAASIRELEVLAEGGFTKESLRDLSNARRFAVHDAELLAGLPTSRTDIGADIERIVGVLGEVVRSAVALIGSDELRDAVTAAIADGLRERANMLELGTGDVENGELVEESEEAA